MLAVTPDELALRVRLERGCGMRAVVLHEGTEQTLLDVAEALASEITSVAQIDVVRIDRPLNARVLESGVTSAPAEGAILATDFSHYGAADWHHLDVLRSRFERVGPLLFLMRSADGKSLNQFAPSFSSWMGVAAFELRLGFQAQLGVREREARLVALQEHFGISSEEMLRRAQGGQLPTDPEFSEWLILLGRSDLIAR